MICLSQIICEQCSHCDDADVNGSINIAQKARTNLGLDTLRMDSSEVTPTNTLESSLPLGDEPGNPATSTVKQLRLLSVKSVPVEEKPTSFSPKRRPRKPKIGTQLDLFNSFDGDDEELVS
jgi:putative transposase